MASVSNPPRTSHKSLYEAEKNWSNVLTNKEFNELKRRLEAYDKELIRQNVEDEKLREWRRYV